MKNKIFSAIIVDDERLARKELRSMLSSFKKVDIVAEADNVDTAIVEINKHKPDVIFLDIQMPGKSGFDLLNLIDIDSTVVFVTAFDEFAIRAFEINALDYLLKPINPDRLEKTIRRIEDEKTERSEDVKDLKYDDHMLLNINSKLKFIKVDNIISINAARDYSEIVFNEGKKGLTLKTMKEWEERLPSKHFCRIHRSTIVNLNYVVNIEEWFNNSYKVYMKDYDEALIMSRRFVANLKTKMG
jgi:two-component system LytT family response regulator